MNIRNEIKSIIVKNGWTITDIAKEMQERYGIETSTQNLSNKLSRGTIKYTECKMIAEIIGYDIEWIKRVCKQENT